VTPSQSGANRDPQDRTAVVTGAGGGIGAAVARALAELGYSVLSIDLRFPNASTAGVRQVELDITEQAPLLELVDSVPADSVDVVVNAAAIRPTGSVLHVDPDVWRRCFEVNVTGTYLVSRAFLPKLRPNSTIVNVCSAAAYGRHELAAYAASKAAILSLTKCMALDHAQQAVRVNAVLPGTTATPMLEQMWGHQIADLTTRQSPRTLTGLVLSADSVARGIIDVIENLALTSGAIIPIGLLPYEW
jgi:NAD(P)-dependent dehydrogenase (short-subunit alcohol dehydrogenase family)